jgi:hypothetical protein
VQIDLDRREVELYGVRFPILGPVQRIPVSPFPAKITIGDYSRDDELVASSWVQTDWSGGFGVEKGRYPQDQDRFWYSTCETRWIRHLTLPPAVVRKPLAVDSSNHARSAQVPGVFYFALGQRLYTISGSGLDITPRKNYPGSVTDLLYDGTGGKLWIALGDAGDIETTTNGTNFTAVTGKRAKLLGFLGGWVYILKPDSTVEAWDGTGWVAVGKFPLPESWVHQLFPYARPDGEETLYALCSDGLWVLDRSVNRWFKTQVSWPVGVPVGRACLWRGEVYLPVGSSVLRWNGQVLASVGPDRDQGLPPEFPDLVRAVLPSHGWVLALVEGFSRGSVTRVTVQPSDALQLGLPESLQGVTYQVSGGTVNPERDQVLAYTGVLLASSGGGWSFLAGEQLKTPLAVGVAEIAGASYALYHTGNQLCLVQLPASLHNPIQPKVLETEPQGTLLTPWFDAGWAEIDKVALRLKVRSLRASPNLRVRVRYRTAPGPWTHLGWVTQPGETELDLGVSGEYPVFRVIQIRLDLERLSGSLVDAPVIESVALSFLRRPDQRYAFQFTVDLSGEWRGRSAKELRDALLAILESPQPGTFRFPEGTRSHFVVLSRLQWAHAGGLEGFQGVGDAVGRAAVSVIEV